MSLEQPSYSVYTKDPNEFLINGMMELLDQYDHMSITKKLANGRRTKVRKDTIKGCGVAPLGYRWQHEGMDKPIIIIIEESEAKIVKYIFKK
ncbi:hypothetical protein CJ195_03590 [Bacillus sp. UMB0899]|uniref:hypothetical protein n=1 Tax=Metabacillus schmidteae TaxID=2730405 RepID=UPI000C8097C4|nr:hypothetical protein [Metabacillus schmidteae]PMC40782.1 hypothetical protein CJ195_03590 [Bacillus sp. UMB0899]